MLKYSGILTIATFIFIMLFYVNPTLADINAITVLGNCKINDPSKSFNSISYINRTGGKNFDNIHISWCDGKNTTYPIEIGAEFKIDNYPTKGYEHFQHDLIAMATLPNGKISFTFGIRDTSNPPPYPDIYNWYEVLNPLVSDTVYVYDYATINSFPAPSPLSFSIIVTNNNINIKFATRDKQEIRVLVTKDNATTIEYKRNCSGMKFDSISQKINKEEEGTYSVRIIYDKEETETSADFLVK